MTKEQNRRRSDTRIKIIAAFAVIYFVWGSTYLAIRLAIDTIPPFLMAGFRFTIAGILFCGWFYLRAGKKPNREDWKKAAITGILMVVCANGLVTWSELYISSGFVSLIVATVPIWLVIMDWAYSRSSRPNWVTIAGITLGLGGVVLLSGMDREILTEQAEQGRSVILGVAILTFASISWAAGSIFSRKMKTTVSIQYMIGMQTLIGGLVLISIGSLKGEWAGVSLRNLSVVSVSALLYLTIFGTIIAYSAYVWLLRVSTPARVGTYAYFNPVVAIFLGTIFLNEAVTSQMLIGTGLILVSLLMVNQPKFQKKRADVADYRSVEKDPITDGVLRCEKVETCPTRESHRSGIRVHTKIE
jgi:drug/metabolite transporter (DMT)-like permease